jgi:L-threonylcarbamoyladenylate synthase
LILPESSLVLPGHDEYVQAVQALQQGGIVAYPTETFYGLAVDPCNASAVDLLYRVKKRASAKAISLLMPDITVLSSYLVQYPASYKILIQHFWPGPLTLIFDSPDNILQHVSKKDLGLAIRISSHPVAHEFCRLFGGAITASSANISGEVPLCSAEAVKEVFGDTISYVLDGGKTPGISGSTIIKCMGNECHIIRQGIISQTAIRNALPDNYTICNE